MQNILIVEDDQAIAALIAASLDMAGYAHMASPNGSDALFRLQTDHFDLILLDVMLPGMDGFELMELIRGREIPVIFLTARDKVADRVKGLKMGAEDYIVKPFDTTTLLVRIEKVLTAIGHKAGRPKYAGRAASAAPATGLLRRHNQEQAKLLNDALSV